MIRNNANEILNLIKKNEGFEKSEIYTNPNIEIQKIIDIILSECRCSILDSDGNYSRFGSSTDIRIIKSLIQIFMSNLKQIPPEIVSTALIKEEILGPFIKVNIEKKYNEENNFYEIEIEEIFPNEFNINIFKDNLEIRSKFIEEILKPYVKNIIFENDELMDKSPIGARISKKFGNIKTEEELLENLIEILKSVLKTEEKLINNIANYILVNIMNNKYFKKELINRTKYTTELQKLGKVYTGFNSLLESMASEAMQMIELRSFPYGEIICIKDTFYTLAAVLIALSTNLEKLDENKILEKIEETNRNYNITNRTKNLKKAKYRTNNITTDKYGNQAEFVEYNKIPNAMNNICKMIKILLEQKENMENETYIKEVIRIHYRFLRISPFESGNGKTARALVNMLLQSKGMIGIFRKEKRKEYIEYIVKANKIIKPNECKYIEALIKNPMECIETENEFLEENIPFLLAKG